MNTRLLAIACAMACHLPARAETPYALDEIVVTANRFEQEQVIQPAQVRVIGPDEIAASNALTVPDLVERAAGLSVRSLYGDTPSAVELDARGYGETGSSHVLVLLDGRRLNAPDSNAVDMWSTIPLSRVERIEVQYGSGTVLYGDNAVGAVVNIVTRDDRSATTSSGRAGLTAGSFGTLQGNGALTLAGPALTGRLDVAATRSDGYRDHERSHGASAGGRIATRPGELSAFVDFGLGRLDADLPGYLTLDQARADPRASVAGNGQGDSQRDTWHLRPGLVYKPAEGVTVQAELGYDANHLDSALSYDIGGGYLATSRVANDYDTLSFTPRLNLLHRLFGLDAESVLGVDLYRTDFDSKRDYFGVTRLNMRQDSQALYAQTSLQVGAGTVVTAGARRQRVDQSLDRTASSDLDNDQARTAWDLGISQQLTPSARLFARHGRVFRFARSDELTTYTGLGIPLRPEHGRSSDVGIDWHGGRGRLQATLYRQDLADEIAYNANPDGDWSTYDGRNENLQRTRHQGLTVDASLKLAADLLARAGYSYTRAYFTAGADTGKTIPLVPRQEARLGLNWRISPEWQADGRLNWSSSRYYGSDTDNSAARLAGVLTVDLAATWQRGAWQVRLDGRNLTDKHYATTGFEYLASQYPADGRAFYLSLAYEGDL